MKAILLMSLLCPVLASCQEKYAFRITVKVVDDEGRAVESASVNTFAFDHWKPGEGFGKDIHTKIEDVTDRLGVGVLEAISSRCEQNLRVSRDGHYNATGFFKSVTQKNGRWQPWDPTVQLVLKRIRNPIPLIAKIVSAHPGGGSYAKMPADKAAYDLQIGDWTAPHGAGKMGDLVFEIHGRTDDGEKEYSTTLKLSFSNPNDGLHYVERPKNNNDRNRPYSELIMPYEAPLEGYAPEKNWKKTRINSQVITGRYISGKTTDDTRPDEDYFLRLRTQVDESGKIISAYYAKVQDSFLWHAGGGVRFKYYFNPTPNDRNLEFDPKRNLLPGEPFEKVTDP